MGKNNRGGAGGGLTGLESRECVDCSLIPCVCVWPLTLSTWVYVRTSSFLLIYQAKTSSMGWSSRWCRASIPFDVGGCGGASLM